MKPGDIIKIYLYPSQEKYWLVAIFLKENRGRSTYFILRKLYPNFLSNFLARPNTFFDIRTELIEDWIRQNCAKIINDEKI